MPALVLILLAAAVPLALLAPRLPARARPLWLATPAAAAFALLAAAGWRTARTGETARFERAWVPQLDVDFALAAGGPGLLLALLVTGIGALIMAYAAGYMGDTPASGRLFALLYAFMLSMAGIALADQLLVLFVFWELTSVTSYLLIGFNHDDARARRNALQALLVTGLGGLALLGGFILLADAAGSWRIGELAAAHAEVIADPRYPAILALVLLGAFTKSAQFPFHFWLPNAMAAPTPVSAYLHSATMVKAGVFLLLVLLPVLGSTTAWTVSLTTVGAITLLLGGVSGLKQTDLKRVLAGSTLAVLGLLTLLIGIGTEKAVLAALVFLLGHALYKACLFMVAGAVDHATGTRDTRELGGLARVMPWTAAAALGAALSKMGLPPFFGFLGKEYTYKAGLASGAEWLLTAVLLAGNAMLLAMALKAAVLPFWRRRPPPGHPREVSWSMRAGPLLLAALGLLVGSIPSLSEPLVAIAKSAVVGYPVEVELELWQGFNLPLLLTAFTIAAGLGIVAYREPLARLTDRLTPLSAEAVYDACIAGLLKIADWQTRFLQSGRLRNYLLTIVGATALLVLLTLWRFGGLAAPATGTATSPAVLLLAPLMLAAVALGATTRSRLTAVVALGVVGLGVALIYAAYSAPDLAVTQILVETLTVALFAWVVHKLPPCRDLSRGRTRLLDAVVASAVGVLVSLLVLKSKHLDLGGSVSRQLTEWSHDEAYGGNVVNVILVDFRALDTWGEITVLAIAALGVWALLRSRPAGSGKGGDP